MNNNLSVWETRTVKDMMTYRIEDLMKYVYDKVIEEIEDEKIRKLYKLDTYILSEDVRDLINTTEGISDVKVTTFIPVLVKCIRRIGKEYEKCYMKDIKECETMFGSFMDWNKSRIECLLQNLTEEDEEEKETADKALWLLSKFLIVRDFLEFNKEELKQLNS